MNGFRIHLMAVCVWISTVTSYSSFRTKIPNGYHVQYPSCKPNHVWEGVGHFKEDGGGPRNQFGLDFLSNGLAWTTLLCQTDSDGDGLTNGEELGDPDCVWSEGHTPTRETNITHPGIGNPFNAQQFAQQNANFKIDCDQTTLQCSTLDDPGTFNMTFSFPTTPVPAKKTAYMCMAFDFPHDQDYHMVGFEPVIDNVHVMHHAVVFACEPSASIPAEEVGVPYECGMSSRQGCYTMLGVWSLGTPGHCVHANAGIRVGLNAYTQGVIQFHWNNPFEDTSLTDASGMKFHFTSNLRTHDAGIFILGQKYLEIPPGLSSHIESAECPADCTNQYFSGDVNVYAALNHMHYFGKSMKTEVYRNNSLYTDIANEPFYFYDSPVIHEYNDTIILRPGDKLVTTCIYQTLSQQNTILNNGETDGEMCYTLLYYYPITSMTGFSCIAYKGVSECEEHSGIVNGCNYQQFHNYGNQENTIRLTSITDNCELFGSCTADCFNAQMSYKDDPCFNGDANDLIVSKSSFEVNEYTFHAAMETCKFCYRFYNLKNEDNKGFYEKVVDNCQPFGNCFPQCQKAIDDIRYHPCMRNDTRQHFHQYAIDHNDKDWLKFHASVASCN